MIRQIIFLSLIVTLLFSCKNDKQALANISPETALPQGFEEFYNKFHSDTAFQKAHILFPLPGRPSSMDTTINYQGGEFFWQENNWKYHSFFDPESGFDREFEIISDQMVNEIYEHHALPMTMLRRFVKNGDDWRLIFYAAPGH
jgi:hypothetical protein